VWDWAADCSRLVVLWRQRSCLQNCCASDWQWVFEVGRTQLSDMGISDERTVIGQVTRGVAVQWLVIIVPRCMISMFGCSQRRNVRKVTRHTCSGVVHNDWSWCPSIQELVCHIENLMFCCALLVWVLAAFWFLKSNKCTSCCRNIYVTEYETEAYPSFILWLNGDLQSCVFKFTFLNWLNKHIML